MYNILYLDSTVFELKTIVNQHFTYFTAFGIYIREQMEQQDKAYTEHTREKETRRLRLLRNLSKVSFFRSILKDRGKR